MNETGAIRVLIVDDHAIVRKGIKALLATESIIQVVGEASNGQEAIDRTLALRPDVVLMDLVMPVVDGLEAIRYLGEHQPETRILVLTSFAGMDKVMPAIRAGALGYLLKDSGPEDLVYAIRQVYSGNSLLHPAIARQLLDRLAQPGTANNEAEELTEREQTVLKLVAQGYSNREIAEALTVSEATVRTHVSHVLTKLDLCSRTQAALYALRKGLVSLDDEQET